MRKKQLLIPSLLVIGSLTACNNNDRTAMNDNRNVNPYTNVSHYNDVRDNNNYNGVGYGVGYGNRGRNNDYYNRVGYDNGGRNSGYGYNDGVNNTTNVRTKTDGNAAYNVGDNTLATKINRAVRDINGVKKARTITYGDNVLVAVTKTNAANQNSIEKSVRKKVNNYTKGRDVKVYFGEENYRKLDDINNDVIDGKNINITNRVKNSFTDVKNNVKRNVKDIDLIPNNR